MKKEWKLPLIVGGIVLIISLLLVISYFVADESKFKEEKTFTNFVGEAYRDFEQAFARYTSDTKIEKITRDD